MDHLPTGEYSLRNVEHKSFAAFVNGNDYEPALSVTLPVGAVDDPTIGHKWVVTRHQNGTYTIKNKTFNVFAWVSIDSKTVHSTRTFEHGEAAWYISRSSGAAGYHIINVRDQRCWMLPSRERRTPIELIQTSSGKHALWIFENETFQYPNDGLVNLSRVSGSPYDPRKEVIMYDFQCDIERQQKIDIVTVFIVDQSELEDVTGDTLRILSSELGRLTKNNFLRVDIQLGAVALVRDGSSWSLTWSSLVPQALFDENEHEYSNTTSISFSLNTAIEKAIATEWRTDAARIIMFSPRLEPTQGVYGRTPEITSSDVLIGEVKMANMLLVIDASRRLFDRYVAHSESFFWRLGITSPRETVSIPEKAMANWMLASALYKNDVKLLIALFQPLAKPWSARSVNLHQQLPPTTESSPLFVSPVEPVRPMSAASRPADIPFNTLKISRSDERETGSPPPAPPAPPLFLHPISRPVRHHWVHGPSKASAQGTEDSNARESNPGKQASTSAPALGLSSRPWALGTYNNSDAAVAAAQASANEESILPTDSDSDADSDSDHEPRSIPIDLSIPGAVSVYHSPFHAGQLSTGSGGALWRPLADSRYEAKRTVTMFDFQSNNDGRTQLDIVVFLTLSESSDTMLLPNRARDSAIESVMNTLSGELHHLLAECAKALDIRLGAAIYTGSYSHWALTTYWVTRQGTLRLEDEYTPGLYNFSSSLQTALAMKWRDNAARTLVFSPTVAQLTHEESYQDLISQVKANHMLLILNASDTVSAKYKMPTKFFDQLGKSSLNETVVVPETVMVNWIVASASSKYSVRHLIDQFGQYAKAWVDGEKYDWPDGDKQKSCSTPRPHLQISFERPIRLPRLHVVGDSVRREARMQYTPRRE